MKNKTFFIAICAASVSGGMEIKMKEKAAVSFMKYIGKLGAGILAGTLLLLAVYALPVAGMKENVARSSAVFDYEGNYPQMAEGYKYMQLDNYTDSIMLGAAIYGGTESLIQRAMNNYHIDCDALPPVLALTNYANDADYDYYTVAYGRYWHGYLTWLKPLLLFFDYSDIRVLNFFLQNILLFLIIKRLYRNHLERYMAAFLITVFLLNPLTAALSLQFSSVYYVMLFSVIYLLCLFEKKKADVRKTNDLFFVTGILTGYFDFLTYPLVPFGMLLTLYLNKKQEDGEGIKLKEIFAKGALWSGGYGGMWGGKWLAGSILTGTNMFRDALRQAFFRTSSAKITWGGYSRLDAVIKNCSVFLKWPFLLLFLLGMGYGVYQLRKLALCIVRQKIVVMMVYCGVALLPVAWIVLMANHSYEHYWFTYKEFGVSSFALLSLGTYLKHLVYDKKT